ncbi:Small nuclear ribonucleoprotein Sm D3 [Fusarium oxysporum f. sp. cubense race 1]|uniref:Small nuclear ribonucleoprotein Sm D3 n=1 Tax=Fusarium oxysporum f. sp. cubense (strain race 1) TaxID=1229664 RepID=N4U0P6_FUSC1|nr:Small nuclear ribonucleoprotein Sm D3 [Fusarium oxysporum f. sp. cubense race 1]
MSVNEATSQGSSQAPELSTCSTVATPTTSDPPVSTQEVYGQQNDQLVVSTKTTEDSMLMSGALQAEADTTETVVVISNSNAPKRKSTTSKKQKEKKKHGKKLDVDKRKQVSNKAKVNKCVNQTLAGSDQLFSTSPQPRPCVHATTRKSHRTTNMTSTIGIPIKLLNEAQGHIVTLEITSGQTYRGKLLDAEDNMNVQLKDITVTARDGRVSHLDQVYIRGSHVRFFIVPDMLRNAPMFRSRNVRGRGVGLARGRATVSRARAGGRGGR